MSAFHLRGKILCRICGWQGKKVPAIGDAWLGDDLAPLCAAHVLEESRRVGRRPPPNDPQTFLATVDWLRAKAAGGGR